MKDFFGFHLDSIGFWASLICAAHCAVLPVFIMFFSWSALRVTENSFAEAVVISSTLCLALISLLSGYAKHNRLKAIYFLTAGILFIGLSRLTDINLLEICLTSLGATLLGTAHYFNWKLSAVHQRQRPKN